MPRTVAAVIAAWCGLICGCSPGNREFLSAARMAGGLVIILPGIEGPSPLNHNIRRGLAAGGVRNALAIHSWGRPVPIGGPLLNQLDIIGNRLAAADIARRIVRYQDSHPGRPVWLVGHSAGGGIAVFAAEALPKGRKVDGLILLSASISGGYDLTKALERCRRGIVNFHNPADVGLLGIGTMVVGNVDGGHGPSAGLTGFSTPGQAAESRKRLAYSRLFQQQVGPAMTGLIAEPHASTTGVQFVADHVAPWVLSADWPAKAKSPLSR